MIPAEAVVIAVTVYIKVSPDAGAKSELFTV
jgi:hypothetical protein